MRQGENTDMLGEAGGKSVSSQLSPELLNQMHFMTHESEALKQDSDCL